MTSRSLRGGSKPSGRRDPDPKAERLAAVRNVPEFPLVLLETDQTVPWVEALEGT